MYQVDLAWRVGGIKEGFVEGMSKRDGQRLLIPFALDISSCS